MGKHERKQIEEAEKIIVKILNLESIPSLDKQNHWFRHAVNIAETIKKDFPNIKKAQHLGNRYDNTGDILLITSDKREIFIEVKMSDTRLGVGTKANISQDALTENYLFVGKVKSWKDNFFQEIQDLLVYYGNSYNDKILVRKENTGKKIKKLLKEFSGFKIIFPSGTTHCKLVGIKGKKNIPLLQIVLHWKNIAQGIKTPCLNIFDLTSKLINYY